MFVCLCSETKLFAEDEEGKKHHWNYTFTPLGNKRTRSIYSVHTHMIILMVWYYCSVSNKKQQNSKMTNTVSATNFQFPHERTQYLQKRWLSKSDVLLQFTPLGNKTTRSIDVYSSHPARNVDVVNVEMRKKSKTTLTFHFLKIIIGRRKTVKRSLKIEGQST